MPVDFLSPAQRENYGRYPNDLAPEFIANYFFLDDQDREWIRNKRGAFSRLGYALQLTTARFVGTFYSDLTEIPYKIIERIATQINVADIQNSLERYQKSEQRWRHTVEIRTRYGFTEFNEEGIRFKLGRWLYALFWTGTDRPGLLFEQTVLWLINNKVLLPGITTVERFIAEIRSRMDTRLWRSLIKNLTNDQTEKLNNLLLVAEKQRQSLLDILRKGPVRASSKTLVKALKRIEMARELSIVLPKRLPEGRVSVLSRFANTAKTTAISRLSYERKMATLVAFAHHFEATAQDDALDILSIVLSELFSKAKRTNHKTRLRTIKDLDSAAATLIDACKVVLDNNLTDQEVRSKIFNIVGYEELIIAVTEVNALIQPPDDVFYRELEDKEQTIKNFLPSLLRVIHFDSNEAGKPIIQALDWLKSKSKKEAPMDLVSKTWKRYIHDKENQFNKTAYIFCVLDKLQGALKRRDLFISPSWRYSDPRANLHGGTEWEAIRPVICRSLNLTNEPHGYLQEFVNELDETYKLVAKNFDNNPFIRFDLIKGSEELILTQLDKLDEPESLKLLRSEVKSRLPRVDLPEVLLEIAKRTNFISAFTHINEGNARAVDLEISICAVLLAQACNTGLEPFVREDIPALKRDRLIWVDQNYIRDETITASNAILVAAQNQSKLAKKWGGGDIASADGMRFVVPVRSLHAAPNPKYFNQGRGVTWYNLLSNQRTGLNDVTVPGTLRDSLILLGVVLEQQTELKPTRIMTDTGAYSDIVFGLFRLLGYRFSPRLADLGDARFWRVDPLADYGKLNILAKHRANLERIIPHWSYCQIWCMPKISSGGLPV